MYYLIGIGFLGILGVSAYQDFRSRAISWIYFPLLFGFSSALGIHDQGLWLMLQNLLYIFLFVILQLILVTIYFSIREGRIINIVNEYLGIGDILFLLALSPIFTLSHFIVFVVSSLCLTLIVFSILRLSQLKRKSTIPLAGFLAVILIIFFLTNRIVLAYQGFLPDYIIALSPTCQFIL